MSSFGQISLMLFRLTLFSLKLIKNNMERLKGKIAIVTGAAQGMGESHARTFIAEGAKVVLTDLNEERGKSHCRRTGRKCYFHKTRCYQS